MEDKIHRKEEANKEESCDEQIDAYEQQSAAVYAAACEAFQSYESRGNKEKSPHQQRDHTNELTANESYIKLVYGETWLPFSSYFQDYKRLSKGKPPDKRSGKDDPARDAVEIVLQNVWKDYEQQYETEEKCPNDDAVAGPAKPTDSITGIKFEVSPIKKWASPSIVPKSGPRRRSRRKMQPPEEIRFRKLLHDMQIMTDSSPQSTSPLSSITEERE